LAVSKLCPWCVHKFKPIFLTPLIMTPALNSETPRWTQQLPTQTVPPLTHKLKYSALKSEQTRRESKTAKLIKFILMIRNEVIKALSFQ